ncbi:MAG: thioredoxin domain-containing protein, partial [Gammaproteobacteria bacterium]
MSEASAVNRLSDQTSPYLRQHAGQPVAWQPWDDNALELARHTDRPILLSIGYAACHWCHVMAHECFDDPAIAETMNRFCVNIKVDREQRPDLDRVYQTAHQLLTRRAGGWPLTVFLDPHSLIPFFAGTYFPPAPRHGMPGFADIVERVATFYREHHGEIVEQA